MRNPERIPQVLETLRKIWERYPDLRLMQLLLNVARPSEHWQVNGDMYHVEDAELEQRLVEEFGSK